MKEKFTALLERVREIYASAREVVAGTFSPVVQFAESMAERYPIIGVIAVKISEGLSWLKKTVEPALKGGGRKTVGYAALFFVSLMIFVILGFDTNSFKNYLEYKVKSKTGISVSIGKLGFSFPPGIRLRDLSVIKESEGLELKLSDIRGRILFSTLFTGTPQLRVVAYEKNGSLIFDAGKKLFGDKKFVLSIDSKNFPIHEIVVRASGKEFPAKVSINAKGGARLLKDLNSAEANLNIDLRDIKISEGIYGEGLMKKMSPHKAVCDVSLKERKLATKNCEIETPLGFAELNLNTILSPVVNRTPLSGTVIVKKPTGFLEPLLSMNEKLRKPDGSYHIPMKGTFASPGLVM
ncbi:MAG: type II secretion system protein GspN [Nitrospinota bacterium]|nr:type II secretion system protein GspN [Nitrospinota bacterium]